VHREERLIAQLRSRPVLAQPLRAVEDRSAEVGRARAAARRDINRLIAAESDRIGHLSARLSTLGPAATLARGYSVVQAGSRVLRSVDDAPAGTALRIRVADGAVTATSTGPQGREGVVR
jgi:exodeoxyribonuclease VII large subunit